MLNPNSVAVKLSIRTSSRKPAMIDAGTSATARSRGNAMSDSVLAVSCTRNNGISRGAGAFHNTSS
jgi:hypothetical protein